MLQKKPFLTWTTFASLGGWIEGPIWFADDARITTLFLALIVIVTAIAFFAIFDDLVTTKSTLPICRKRKGHVVMLVNRPVANEDSHYQ